MASDSPGFRRALAIAIGAAVLSAFVYSYHLDSAPIYLTKDEASFGIQSHALATTGRDVDGNRLPLFFQEPGFSIGRDPIYIYLTALVLQWLPMTDGALRVSSVAAAVLAIGLVVLVGRELFQSNALAFLSGLFLTVTPVLFIRSRAALSVVFPVAFQLLWFLFLLIYLRTQKVRYAVLATASLGVGLYSYLSMMVFAPMHIVVTIAALGWLRQWRHLAIALGTFAITLAPLAVWQATHPERLSEIVGSYQLYDPNLNVLQGTKDLLSWFSLGNRADVYWQVFNPSRLFFQGESSPVDSTRAAGLFPLVYALLLPIGLFFLCRTPWSFGKAVVVFGFFTAPLPTIVVGTDTIGRYLIITAYASLIATAAVAGLWASRNLLARIMAVATVVSSVWLFQGFVADYVGDWPVRSASYLGGNLRGAMETILREPPAASPDLIFLSAGIPYVETFWEFYRRANERDDLIGRVRGLSASMDDWHAPPARAMAITAAGETATIDGLRQYGWSVKSEISEPFGGPPTFLVWSRP